MNADASQPADRPRRARRSRRRVWTAIAVVAWFAAMSPLAWWGLPSSADDDLLFAEEPWPAEAYAAEQTLAAREARGIGADTDIDPLQTRDRVIDLTSTPADRAAILRRYRLFSRHPDEMITLMALQRMRPRALDFDPRLYQYGGAYIYLVGALLGVAGVTGLVELTTDAGVYLEHPDLFGRFYVVARFISLVAGAAALVAVQRLATRAAGSRAGWIALVLVAASPVFISGALEAKPHLPSACLILWATLFALRYFDTGRRRDAIAVGLLGGLAFGFVLTGLAAGALLPALLVARRPRDRRVLADLALAAGCALGVYALTNPYVVYNALFRPDLLASNIGNSTAMYTIDRLAGGALRVSQLLAEGISPGGVLVGLACGAWLAVRRSGPLWISALPGVALVVLCAAIGAGKPAEFGRFLVLPAALLAVAAAAALRLLAHRHALLGLVALVAVAWSLDAVPYLRSFAIDARRVNETRRAAARFLAEAAPLDEPVGVVQEPAPYSIPPLAFDRRTILHLPARAPGETDIAELPVWLVLTADEPPDPSPGRLDDHYEFDDRYAWWVYRYELERRFPPSGTQLTPITWANKPVFIYRRISNGG